MARSTAYPSAISTMAAPGLLFMNFTLRRVAVISTTAQLSETLLLSLPSQLEGSQLLLWIEASISSLVRSHENREACLAHSKCSAQVGQQRLGSPSLTSGPDP